MMLRRMACALLAIAFLGCLSPAATLADDAPTTLRVAYWERGGRYEQKPDGSLAGYDAELLKYLASQSDFTVRFIPYSTTAEAISAIEKGHADIVTGMIPTASRRDRYLFSSLSTGLVVMGLIAPKERTDLIYQDSESPGLGAIGYEINSGNTQSCVSYCRANYPGAALAAYRSVPDLRRALEQGDIDAIATSANNLRDNEKLLDLFSPSEVYYMTTRKNAVLMQMLNDALLKVVLDSPNYLSDLQHEYFPMYFTKEYSKAQLDFVAGSDELTVGVPLDRKPICWYDEASGSFKGILIDLSDTVAKSAGLRFHYEAFDQSLTTHEALESGRYDLVAPELRELSLGDEYSLTDPFLSTQVNLGVPEGKPVALGDGMRLGVTREASGLCQIVQRKYPEAEFVVLDSQEATLSALRAGELDAMLNSSLVWYYLRQNPAYDGLTLLPDFAIGISYCLAGSRDRHDRLLFDTLDVAISRLGSLEQSAAVSRHTSSQLYAPTFGDRLRENWQAFGFGLFLILTLIVVIIRRSHHYSEVARQSLIAQERVRAKSLFFSQVSHDLRTPMNAVLGFARLASDEPGLSATVSDYLDKIKTSGAFLLSLLNDVLDVSKIENAKLELVEEPMAGYDFAVDLAELYGKEAALYGIKLHTDFAYLQEQWLYADRLRLQQVISNLLGNAIKYSPSGTTIRWTVSCRALNDTEMETTTVLSDEGCGMSKEFLAHLFEPFEQERNEFSARQASTGLGLTIVRYLVELMHGDISVESELGKGTTFTIRLTHRVAQPPKGMAQGRKPLQDVDLTDRRVLLCEDQPLNQQIAMLLLEKKGILVDCAANGQLGLDAFINSSEGFYDAILMDVRMPVMDGLDATRAIRAQQRSDAKAVPIIAMTANAFSEDISETASVGMDAHVIKPVAPDELYETIARLVS